jgi:hypothetical protein
MSDSVALVAIERVKNRVRNEVHISESHAALLSRSRNVSVQVARDHLLSKAVEKALHFAKNDERVATTALVITAGRVNRLPQCTHLLRKHEERTVRTAYDIKDELAIASTSLRVLCQMLEHTDEDVAGEATRLRDLLEQIAISAVSDKQQWFFYHRIRQMLSEGHMIESIEDEILERMNSPFDAPAHSGVG